MSFTWDIHYRYKLVWKKNAGENNAEDTSFLQLSSYKEIVHIVKTLLLDNFHLSLLENWQTRAENRFLHLFM